MKIGMVIDLERCIGCRTCAVVCKQHHAQPPGTWWNRVFTPGSHEHLTPPEHGQTWFLPVSCQHCEEAACEKVCPVNASFKDADGAVLVDFERCIGCRYCMAACPYGVRQFNWSEPAKLHAKVPFLDGYRSGYPKEYRIGGRLVYAPERPKGVTEKCTLCPEYRKQGLPAACVQACPTRARTIGDHDDPASEVSRLVRGRDGFRLLPEKGTKPMVTYLPPLRRKEA